MKHACWKGHPRVPQECQLSTTGIPRLCVALISYPDLTLFYTPFPLAVGDLGTRLVLRYPNVERNNDNFVTTAHALVVTIASWFSKVSKYQ